MLTEMTINVDTSTSESYPPYIEKRVKATVYVLAAITTLLALIVMIGWFIDFPLIIKAFPNLRRMQLNTAVEFIFLSISIILVTAKLRLLSAICSFIVFVIGLLTLIEYLFHVNFGINEFLLSRYVPKNLENAGRIIRNSALNFCLLSLGIFVYSVWISNSVRWFLAFLAAVSFSLVLIALSGFVLGDPSIDIWFKFTDMGFLTAVGFAFLSSSCYFLSWTYQTTGKPAKWVIVPLGLVSFLTLFAMWRLHDVVLITGDGKPATITEQYAIISISLFLTGFGLYVFKKSVENTQKLEMISSHSLTRGREREMLLYYLNEEVRAPLFAIQGYLEMLKIKPEEDILNKAISASVQVHHVLNDLVVMMQVGTTGLIATKHEVNFEEVYELLTTTYEREAKMHRISFEHKVEGQLHAYIVVDWEKVNHVLSFILHKAFLRTPENKEVKFLTFFLDGEIEFKIIDAGGFINEAEKERILSQNPFAKQEKLDRTHLGFYVCMQLLRSMNSVLRITDIDPSMTEFAFTIST